MHTHMFMYCMSVCDYTYTVKFGYNAMKGTKYFVSLYMSVVTFEGNNVMVNSD